MRILNSSAALARMGDVGQFVITEEQVAGCPLKDVKAVLHAVACTFVLLPSDCELVATFECAGGNTLRTKSGEPVDLAGGNTRFWFITHLSSGEYEYCGVGTLPIDKVSGSHGQKDACHLVELIRNVIKSGIASQVPVERQNARSARTKADLTEALANALERATTGAGSSITRNGHMPCQPGDTGS